MTKSGNIVSYTMAELRALREREGDRTDWARVRAMTEEELEAAIALDPDDVQLGEIDWSRATATLPGPSDLAVLDSDVAACLPEPGGERDREVNRLLRDALKPPEKGRARKRA